MEKTKESCGTCRFWRVQLNSGDTYGFCRWKPESHGKNSDEWCGQYKAEDDHGKSPEAYGTGGLKFTFGPKAVVDNNGGDDRKSPETFTVRSEDGRTFVVLTAMTQDSYTYYDENENLQHRPRGRPYADTVDGHVVYAIADGGLVLSDRLTGEEIPVTHLPQET